MKKAIAKKKCPVAAGFKALARAERRQAKAEAELQAATDLDTLRAALETPEHERRAGAHRARDEYFASAVPPPDPKVQVIILFTEDNNATASLGAQSVVVQGTTQGGEPHIAYPDVKLAICSLLGTSLATFDEALIVTGITPERQATNLRLKAGVDTDTRNNRAIRRAITLSVKLARRCHICGATAVEPLRREFHRTGILVTVCPVTTDACPASAQFTILGETPTVVRDGHTHAVRFIDEPPAPVTFSLYPSASTLIECD